MPVDLNLTPSNVGGGGGNSILGTNPVQLIEGIQNLQTQRLQQTEMQNAIQNQQLDIQARQRAGQIISQHAPTDYDGIQKDLMSDPLVSGRLPDLPNSYRQLQNTTIEGKSKQIDANSKTMDYAGHMMSSAATDPDGPVAGINKAMSKIKSVAGANYADIAPGINSLKDGLLAGVTGNDPQSKAQLTKNAAVIGLQSGLPPDTLYNMLGGTPRQTVIGPYGEGGQPAAKTIGGLPNETNSGQATGAVQGLTPEQHAFQEQSGEAGGDITKELNANSSSLPTSLKRVDMMTSALGQFLSGGGADSRQKLGQFAQALKNGGFDIDDDTINKIANGSLSAGQVFDSLVSRAGVQALKADAQGTGRVMRTEVDKYLEMMGKTNDPHALMTLMNNLKYTMQVGYDRSQKFMDFKQLLAKKAPSVAGLDHSDFPAWYNRTFDPNNLESPKGMNLGQINPGQIKGTENAPPPKRRRYNPDTKEIEEVQ